MAIARVTSGKNGGSGGTSSVSVALDTTSQTNVLIVALVEDRNGSANITTPQYGGNNMTQISTEKSITGPRYYTGWYYLTASGSNSNATCTRTGTTSDFNIFAAAYSGVSQSGFPDASADGSLTQANFSQSITTTASNCWLVAFHGGQGEVLTAGANTTLVQGGAGDDGTLMDSNGARASGSNALAATHNSENYGYWIFSFAPSVAASAIKTVNGLAKASVKTYNGLAIASVKTINGLA